MTHPHHLHATAAAWSLQAARGALATRVRAETLRRGESLTAAGPISSPRYGTRRVVGGHADPVSATLVLERTPARETTWAEVLQRSDSRLAWIAQEMRAPDPHRPALDRIIAGIPHLRPANARLIHLHLTGELDWLGSLPLGWSPVRHPLGSIACPHCGERQLIVQADGPEEAWTVVCATGRLCTGAGCGCGMPGAVEGVAHIWWRKDVIGAVGG
ncbi:hypothetical protein ACPB67_02555 [Micromonospora taraxaci]|uniref:hypothetical protein n=1 Tax=Micromonospora taraxaci TaxID=1316803 RepID=UPI003C2E358A